MGGIIRKITIFAHNVPEISTLRAIEELVELICQYLLAHN